MSRWQEWPTFTSFFINSESFPKCLAGVAVSYANLMLEQKQVGGGKYLKPIISEWQERELGTHRMDSPSLTDVPPPQVGV